jgi:hypothetical protein
VKEVSYSIRSLIDAAKMEGLEARASTSPFSGNDAPM